MTSPSDVDPAPVRRGRLTVYLGAAPGVGKTYAMADEGRRRLLRGTDVVVGLVETHERAQVQRQLEGLEVVPSVEFESAHGTSRELDVSAVLRRAPAVVLIDELAHLNPPGSPRGTRVEDVDALRDAGIDVLTTLNVQHLESLHDEVGRITGFRETETVPDAVVRQADQIQLVDMAPEALRRRLAHGNVFPADQVDASLSSYFRIGNLTALRELALLWVADRVDDALDEYRRVHAIDATWPARQRIVVAVTGGPESETLLRRGARLARRSAGAELMALHVVADDRSVALDERRLDRVQKLVSDLGGSFHSVVGADVPAAVVEFATGANASIVVVGVSRHGRLRRFTRGTGDRIALVAGSIDVHLVTHDQVAQTPWTRPAVVASPLDRSRQILGWLLALLLPGLTAGSLQTVEGPTQLAFAELLLLMTTVVVALVGGLWPALLGALMSFVLLNVFFTEPTGTLRIHDPFDVAALATFVVVAAAVARVVDRASRRAAEASRARAEAATLMALSQSVLSGSDTAEAVVARVQEAFRQDTVSLLARTGNEWVAVASQGEPCTAPAQGSAQVAVDEKHLLVLRGPRLPAGDRRLLEAFAVQTGLVLEYRRLREREHRAAALESAQATSTALLRAVSHDLRTPLATVRAGIEGLQAGARAVDQAELLGTVGTATGKLERLIDDLLDLSRLESGLIRPRMGPHSLDEVLPVAAAGHGSRVVLTTDEDLPWVLTDPGLLERVVANVVSNAVSASPAEPVHILAQEHTDRVVVLVVDHGPGVAAELRQRMFEPFQRLGDSHTHDGLGLGLAVARGLAESIGAVLEAEDTPGGGLTMIITLLPATRSQGNDSRGMTS